MLSLKVVAFKFKHHPSKLRVPNDKYVYFVQSYNCILRDESLPENSVSKAIYCLRFSKKNNEIIHLYTENKSNITNSKLYGEKLTIWGHCMERVIQRTIKPNRSSHSLHESELPVWVLPDKMCILLLSIELCAIFLHFVEFFHDTTPIWTLAISDRNLKWNIAVIINIIKIHCVILEYLAKCKFNKANVVTDWAYRHTLYLKKCRNPASPAENINISPPGTWGASPRLLIIVYKISKACQTSRDNGHHEEQFQKARNCLLHLSIYSSLSFYNLESLGGVHS